MKQQAFHVSQGEPSAEASDFIFLAKELPPLDEPDESWIVFDGINVYPVNRQARPLTREEQQKYSSQIREAKLKELKSWVDLQTVKPILKESWKGKLMTARWVEVWKVKAGEVVIKERLCIKGFQEPHRESEQSASPTAQRASHRIVLFFSCQLNLPIASLDISTAFLQGFSFEEIRSTLGLEQPRLAFTPPDDVWNLLSEIDHKTFGTCATDFRRWALELLKSAYGPRSAPLLWHLKASKLATAS